MSDKRPPEGARYNMPDWTPFPAAEPEKAPPPPPPPATPKTPKTGIEVPITPADFRAHWKELWHYATFASEAAAVFKTADDLGFSEPFNLTHEQRRELDEKGSFTATLLQIEKLSEDSDHQRVFCVDYAEWDELHQKGLVSPHNLSRAQLQALRGIKVFDDALRAIPGPIALYVPLSLEEIRAHWDELRGWCSARTDSSARMFDAIEIVDQEKGIRNPWLTARQRSEIETAGFTYLDIDQVNRMFIAGWYPMIPVDSWFALREKGIVSEHHLTEESVRNLLSVPFFKELFDLKFNHALIKERKDRAQGTLVLVLLAVIAVGFGGWSYLVKPWLDLRADEAMLFNAAASASAWEEKRRELSTVIFSGTPENVSLTTASNPLESIAKAEAKRLAKPAFEIPAFRTQPDKARAESVKEEATSLLFEKKQFAEAADLWIKVFIYDPSNWAALHNLAYAKARVGYDGTALNLVLLTLSIKKQRAAADEPWKTWRFLGAVLNNETAEKRKSAEHAYLVAFALNRDWNTVCNVLLEDGRAFGDGVKQVVTGVFKRLPELAPGVPVLKNCASPPAF